MKTYNPGGTGTAAVAVADVNGDGIRDVMAANTGTVGVLRGNGDGTLAKAATYSSARVPLGMAAADLNGDGKPDLVVADSASRAVEVLLGNGDGTFQSMVSYDSGGDEPSSVAVADLNADGKLDLLVCNSNSNNVGVLLGNGDGTFQAVLSYDSGGTFPLSVAIADVNGDGQPDLLVSNLTSHNVGVLLNNTRGPSATSTSLASNLNPSTYGQKVTLTATVSPSASITPTGTVKFTWGDNIIGSAKLNSTGVAILTKSNLNADPYPLTAVYLGDAANLGSTSAVLNQVVQQATSTATLTSLPNPSGQGEAVTFTARISSPTVTPKGPVTFTAGKTVLGTAQLSSGKASLTIASLAAGSTVVTATYSGDSNIAPSSASVTQTVH
jgi:hypothetical protein